MKDRKEHTRSERVIVTLPGPLVRELGEYAAKFRGGNRSGFVADAIRTHIEQLRKVRHTARLREGYAAAARAGREIAEEWQAVDDEAWDLLEARPKRSRR